MKINTISKKVLLTSAVLLFASTFTFAQEAEVSEEIAEDVTPIAVTEESESIEEEAVPVTATADEYIEASPEKKTTKPKSKIHNPFEGMFEPKQKKYIFYEQTPLSTGTIGYGIKPRTAEIFVDPKTKKVGIQVYYQSSFFDFMFDEKDVALIAEGFEKYLADFDAHVLIKNKTMKTRKMYTSKGNCRVEWGTIKAMINNYGDAKFHVGYEFKKNSPYFCIIVKDCKNIATDLGSNVAEKSVEVQLYFTKAEARQLLEKIGRERVKQELQEQAVSADSY
ncbi:MAG: hypothetical protein PUD17_10345 [Treponema sp.]|uniref:hypothetical protein n=1 Tax=Treponema sp. TaxID=166 RepID=UPI00298E7E76|nr:hypothetical protein [Treponema sp.]MDD5812483.1 hypothetical protein [Treponema sp.]